MVMKGFLICILLIISFNCYCQDSLSQKKIDRIDKLVSDIKAMKTLFEKKDSSYSIDSSFHEMDDFTKTIYYSDRECGKLLKVEYSILFLRDSLQTTTIEYFKEDKLVKTEDLVRTKKYHFQTDFYFENDKILNQIFSEKQRETALAYIDISKELLKNYLSMCPKLKPNLNKRNQKKIN
jgi:hypothetical protein